MNCMAKTTTKWKDKWEKKLKLIIQGIIMVNIWGSSKCWKEKISTTQ